MTKHIIYNRLLIECQSFAPVTSFCLVDKHKYLVFEQYEFFQKAGYRNRYLVLGAEGVQTLSIPVVGGRGVRGTIRTIEIDNRQPWQKQHWRALETCYNNSPYFFFYRHTLIPLFQQPFEKLWDFNLAAFEWVNTQLKWKIEIAFSESFQKCYPNDVTDLRGFHKPGNRSQFQTDPYQQVFGSVFQPNLSILDLLFNLGPDAGRFIEQQNLTGI